ncbi:MAG: hypothetical protein ACOX24_08050 [Christensenellales bacterium]|jgi:cold shock CspA family protein
MKCLFFDLEYANSKGGAPKICEFGYVLTDENFKIIKRDNLIINPKIPRSEWDYYAVRKILTRKISEYERGYNFVYHYDTILNLFQNADFVFAHSPNGDNRAIRGECSRYRLPQIKYIVYDVCTCYTGYSQNKKSLSVTKILEAMGIKGENKAHDAEADAFNTMLAFKEMKNLLNFSFADFPSIYKDFEKKLKENSRKTKGNFRIIYNSIIEKTKPQGKLGDKFKDKKITMSENYEISYPNEALCLVQLIVNQGGLVTLKASESDIFVKYDKLKTDGTLKKDKRLECVLAANDKGKNKEIIDLKELFLRLDITKEQLAKMALESKLFDKEKNRTKKNRTENRKSQKENTKKESDTKVVFSTGASKTTLGDVWGPALEKLKNKKD